MHCTGGDSGPAGAEVSTTEQHGVTACEGITQPPHPFLSIVQEKGKLAPASSKGFIYYCKGFETEVKKRAQETPRSEKNPFSHQVNSSLWPVGKFSKLHFAVTLNPIISADARAVFLFRCRWIPPWLFGRGCSQSHAVCRLPFPDMPEVRPDPSQAGRSPAPTDPPSAPADAFVS